MARMVTIGSEMVFSHLTPFVSGRTRITPSVCRPQLCISTVDVLTFDTVGLGLLTPAHASSESSLCPSSCTLDPCSWLLATATELAFFLPSAVTVPTVSCFPWKEGLDTASECQDRSHRRSQARIWLIICSCMFVNRV